MIFEAETKVMVKMYDSTKVAKISRKNQNSKMDQLTVIKKSFYEITYHAKKDI